MATEILTQERLKELMHYDADTGVFTRRNTKRKARALNGNKYCHCRIDGTLYKAHRLAWLYVYGVWPTYYIDHINRNCFDNRIVNLREATPSQNMQNRARRTGNSSGYLGIVWSQERKRWRARISVDGKQHWLGFFTDLDAAVAARIAAEAVHHPYSPKDDSAKALV